MCTVDCVHDVTRYLIVRQTEESRFTIPNTMPKRLKLRAERIGLRRSGYWEGVPFYCRTYKIFTCSRKGLFLYMNNGNVRMKNMAL